MAAKNMVHVSMTPEEAAAFVMDVKPWRDLDEDQRIARVGRIESVLQSTNASTGKKFAQHEVASWLGVGQSTLSGWIKSIAELQKARSEGVSDIGAQTKKEKERQKKARSLLHVEDPQVKLEIIKGLMDGDPEMAKVIYQEAAETIRNQPDNKARSAKEHEADEKKKKATNQISTLPVLDGLLDSLKQLRAHVNEGLEEEARQYVASKWGDVLTLVSSISVEIDSEVHV